MVIKIEGAHIYEAYRAVPGTEETLYARHSVIVVKLL